MTKKTTTFLKQTVIVAILFCIISTPTFLAALAGQAVEKSQSNSTLSNTNASCGHYFTTSGIEFWDDFEITNEWHTVTTQGTNDYQAAVVYSNYFVKIVFDEKTNKVELSSTLLPLEKVPMRIVQHIPDGPSLDTTVARRSNKLHLWSLTRPVFAARRRSAAGMMLVTKEEFLLAAFSMRIQEILRLHGICQKTLHPDLLKFLWKKVAVEKSLIIIRPLRKDGILDIVTFP